ncbi:MAG: hypothetical protein FD180_2304 [Planctomycetota bacterium]|nr:MAG: hypothetical protein FD180_2304 [Planctomycetota bacterium]
MPDVTTRAFARDQLVPLLFRLSDRLDKRRHDLASAVREFTVRLQDSAGDANPARARSAILWLRPLCVAVRALALGRPEDRALWEEVKEMALEATRLAELPFSAVG